MPSASVWPRKLIVVGEIVDRRAAVCGDEQLFPIIVQPAGVLERLDALDGAIPGLEGCTVSDE